MTPVQYLPLSEVSPQQILPLLNQSKLRKHLIDHPLFDEASAAEWLAEKVQMDSQPGCRVRALTDGQQIIGWCGIQREAGAFELAVVLADSHWGLGRSIFIELLTWAKKFGHEELYLHLLHTRPEYKFLTRRAKKVEHTEIMGSQFTSYLISVNHKA
ncbi:N-acetyltransferase [Halioxenophilus sp. WMMB6]|uniref:N-acetyltransferase n=1 Tax=Halioxenophilus sp. WMMB6 TaxID=3073815 RepID=UPI00295EF1CE|nr:N-acetyltransferase [Halioxenophilus sp. WMMB6]